LVDKVFFKKNIKSYSSNLHIVNETTMKTHYTIRIGLTLLILAFKFNLTFAQLPILASTTGYDTVRHRLQSAYFDSLYVFHEGILTRSGTIDQNTKAFYNLQYIAVKDNRTDTLNLTVHVTDSPGCYIANKHQPYYLNQLGVTFHKELLNIIQICNNNAEPVSSHNIDINKSAVYEHVYTITDSLGIISKAKTLVYVVNLIEPSLRIRLTKGTKFPLGTFVSEMGFEFEITGVSDKEDAWIEIDSSSYDRNTEGSYFIRFFVVKRNLIGQVRSNAFFLRIDVGNSFPVGINGITEFNVQVYPNPSQGAFYLESEWPIQNVQVLGIDGRKVQADYDAATQQLNLTNKGIYLLEAATEKGIVRKRLVVY
jgi:hypothetical protein